MKKKHPIPPLRQQNRFRMLRLARGWTQQEVADLLGCTPSKINMTEMGKRGLNDELAVLAADLYKVSVDYLLCQTDIPTKPEPSKINGEELDMKKEIESIRAYWEEVGYPEYDTNRRKLTRYERDQESLEETEESSEETTSE